MNQFLFPRSPKKLICEKLGKKAKEREREKMHNIKGGKKKKRRNKIENEENEGK